MHAQEVVELILKKAGEDVLKQIELAAAVKDRLTDVNPNKDLPVALAIVESVKSWLKEIKNKFKGRFPNDIRSLYQGVHQAVSLADAKFSDVARVLGTSSRLLKEGRARFWAFIEGKVKDLVEFRGKMRSDKFPEEWAEFIVETWCSDRCTRASERSSDEMRNPNTKKDPEWYRLHFLEKKILTIIDIINEEGKKKFHAEYEYADGQSRPDGFKASYKYITTLRPFFVVPPKRDTAMCIYHLHQKELAAAFFNYRKQLRTDKAVTCECNRENIKDEFVLRKNLTCAADQEFDEPNCYNGKCANCKDVRSKLLGLMCAHEREASKAIEITWQSWRLGDEYKTKQRLVEVAPGKTEMKTEVKRRKDFVKTTAPFNDFVDEFVAAWKGFQVHHHEAKWQRRDWEHKKLHFPKGTFCLVADFAERGKLDEWKLEPQAKYFSGKSYAIFPMVVYLHLEDCTHMKAEEKTKLTKLFDDLGTPDDERIIKETHLVISNDMKQDVAAVEHFLDLLIDTLKKRNPNLSTMYAQSDGCKAQFKNSSFYLWISSQQEKTGVRVDWCYFCSCHGKCDCDPEGGAAKHAVAQQQLRDNMDERTRISTYEDLIQFLMAEFQTPTKSIYQKRGKGIWRRFIHWVPSDSISRDILYAEYSLKLSDPYRQITDVGEPGEVRCRHRSCHQCQVDDSSAVVGDCMHLDVKKCKNNHHCGIAQQRALSAMQLEFDEAAWAKRALALQVQAQLIGHGEIIVVMNDDPDHGAQEPFFIGEAAAL